MYVGYELSLNFEDSEYTLSFIFSTEHEFILDPTSITDHVECRVKPQPTGRYNSKF